MTSKAINLVIFALLVVSSTRAAVLIESGSLNGTEIESAQVYRKGDAWDSLFAPISGKLVNDSSLYIYGNIVFVINLQKRNFWSTIIELRDLGAIAVIHLTNDVIPGREFCIYSGQDADEIRIEVASVNLAQFLPVVDEVNNGSDIFITLTSEGNQWSIIIYHLAAIIVSRVVFGATILGLLGYSLYKLIVYIKAQGAHFNVPQVCLALEFIANIWRIFSLLIDPLGCFQQLPTAFSLWVNAAALPFGTATFVLVTFYWHEIITDSSIKIHPFLSRLKIPFFVITLTLIALDIILIISGYYLGFGATMPITIVYLVISTGFLIFYIITAVQIGARMKAAQKLKRVKRLSRVNSKMILNAVARFCLIVTAIAFAIVDDEPVGYLITCFFLASSMLFDSFARIFLFDMPKKVSTSRSPTNSSDKPTTAAGDDTTNVQL